MYLHVYIYLYIYVYTHIYIHLQVLQQGRVEGDISATFYPLGSKKRVKPRLGVILLEMN
jgi:hypothetical protein